MMNRNIPDGLEGFRRSVVQLVAEYRPGVEGTVEDLLKSITFDEYHTKKIQKLNKEVKNKIKVYLDMNFIIKFRQDLETGAFPIEREIYELLQQLVKDQKIECIFSESIKDEILKQSDLISREKTCQVLDSLSNRVIMIPIHLVFIKEFENLVRFLNNERIIDYYVFDYLSYIPFYYSSYLEKIQGDDDLLKILLFESTSKTITFGELLSLSKNLKGSIVPLLREKSYNPQRHFSKKPLHAIFKDEMYDFVASFPDSNTLPTNWKDLLTLDSFRQLCPSSYIFCGLHAEMRLDSTRNFHRNDYYDINNFSLVIPNCDYFFTEKAFTHRAKTVLKFDKIFNTKIESDSKLILQQLKLTQAAVA